MYESIPDYNDLFEEFEEEEARKEERFPKCDCCGKRITAYKFFNVEGTYICPSCIEDFIVETEDYMED